MNQKQNYIGPFITMVVVMALVGLITNINQQFQAPMQEAFLSETGELKNTFATLINFSFFLAYLLMGNLGAKTIDSKGYRGTLVVGLVILLVGFGLFELSAWQYDTYGSMLQFGSVRLPHAFFIFILGSFVAGTALTFLQAAVNPYIVACNVPGTTGVQRQSIAGTANSLMTTIGPLIVAYVIFGNGGAQNVEISQLYVPFIVLIVLVAILAIALKRINLPDIAGSTKEKGEVLTDSIWSFRHLALGVVAIFFYVGVEVAVGANINLYAKSLEFSIQDAALMASLYWGGMLVGRFIGSFINNIKAQTQLKYTSIIACILVVATIFTNNPWLLVGVGLFHSVMWPAIFALAVDKLGKYTSKGSGMLMMGVFGGAVIPFIQGIAADSIGSWTYTWLIVVVGEIYLLYYAVNGSKVLKSGE